MMKVNLRAKDKLELSAKEKGYVYEKVESLDYMFNDRFEVAANVLCSSKGNVYTVEVTIPTKHLILRAESRADTVFAAIDIAVDKVERQFLKHNMLPHFYSKMIWNCVDRKKSNAPLDLGMWKSFSGVYYKWSGKKRCCKGNKKTISKDE